MGSFGTAEIKDLRERTGAGMMDCKKALEEAGGDIEGAVEVLRKKGLKNLGKRAGKVAAEGTIGVYTHPGDQIVAIVELSCETDFVARGDDFKEVAKGIAMHVSAMSPLYVSEAEVPEEVLTKEKEIIKEQLSEGQKDKADKIIPGKLKKFFEETVLLNQEYIRDDSKKTIQQVVEELSVKVGEKVEVRRIQRFQVGEGIEKPVENLADEVAALSAAQGA